MTKEGLRSLRYGAVPYLNAEPLLAGLAEETGPLLRAVPARLAEMLAAGQVDVALAPVVASFEQPGSCIVPAGAVVARGPVKSVLLFAKRDPSEVRTVALDTSSRTSAALVRVLFEHLWKTRPTFGQRDPEPDLRGVGEDAVLLIGDPALRAVWDGPPAIDLGAAWRDWTNLPFVFAAWIARDAGSAERAAPALVRAAARGQATLPSIARRGAADVGLHEDAALTYLRRHLSFEYGPEEAAGLARFRELWQTTPGLGLAEG